MVQNKNEKDIFTETLIWLCGRLEAGRIPYMITGGSAVGFWGIIRTTMDIDVLIQIHERQIIPFLSSIQDEAYVDLKETKEAILNGRMINVIYNKYCFKADIIPLNENDPFESGKFKRRIKMHLGNSDIYVITPEDLIITKLLWSKSAGGSERQIRDCEGIYRLNCDSMDMAYLQTWVTKLGIEEDFKKLS